MKPIKVIQVVLTVLLLFMAVLLLKEHNIVIGCGMVVLALFSFISVFSKYPDRR